MRKLRNLFREYPFTLAVEYLLRRGLSVIGVGYHHYLLTAQPVPDTPWLNRKRASSYRIDKIMEDDYNSDWFPRPAHIIKSRYRQGAECWVAFKGDRAVGCQWLIKGPYIEDEVRCIFKPGPEENTVWDFDIYIVPEFRFSRLFLQLWDTSNAWMRSQGISWSASRVDALNLDSVKSHSSMGAYIVDHAWFVSIGAMQIAKWRGRFHLSFGTGSIPIIDVKTGKLY
ncbi:N-acetyltransferase [Sedimenticola hydrogenitrophicus]|uniref:N-acetyltransferase n=1 Tax=Sedimenticola hydrogenitrophicus TaxID=2967975 RepID=UPI0021A33C00|nr:N-acetyltransferase [Sedimenticola hydrogenitrophicus]